MKKWIIALSFFLILLFSTGFIASRNYFSKNDRKNVVRIDGKKALIIAKTPDPIILAAGDLHCGMKLESGKIATNEGNKTADVIEKIPEGAVLALGDMTDDGLRAEFFDCYQNLWGKFKERTYPTLGNHELHKIETPGKAYYEYFSDRAGKINGGNYSFDLGRWHLISLNSMPCSFGIKQCESTLSWLENDLRSNPSRCTLAFMHYPRFSSGVNNTDPTMEPIWNVLYKNNVDVVLNGHDHNYERLGLMNPEGNDDKERGIRSFVVGTAGHITGFSAKLAPNSEVRQTDVIGVLKMALHENSYEWEYLPAEGYNFTDYGSEECR